jgi:ABC-type polysaccharide transport system, permease component
MLIPALILITIFSYVPLMGWAMAFKKYQLGMSIFSGEFTGLEQFKAFFIDVGDAWYVIRNTIAINLISLTVNLLSACIFAILINEIKANLFKRAIQSFSFFPFFVSWIITYSIFNSFLSVNSGVINEFLIDNHIIKNGLNFIGDPAYAWPLIIFVSFWKSIGYNSIIFLASISNIDQQLYESADIDGAGRFGKIFFITVPSLIPTLVILLIINSGWIFSSNFEEFFIFTNPTNWERMQVLDVYIYNYGLKLLDFSYATAVGIVKTLASITILIVVNTAAKKLNGKSLL